MNIEKILELCDEPPDDPFKRALKVAIEALEHITNTKWGYDGDCGVNKQAEDALQSISDSFQ